jgi:FtsH-binding integral membrane protein
MQNQFDPRTTTSGYDPAVSVGVPRAARDAGLRSYMLKVYNYMASGVLLTGVVALMLEPFARTNLISQTGGFTGLGWIAALAPLAFLFVFGARFSRMQTSTMQAVFWAFAAIMGVSMSTLLVRFTGVSVAQTFFATTVAFLGLSVWGYTTKKDLSGWGTFLIMGVWGILGAIVINWFLRSPAMYYAISAIGVLIFAGLTAYDTQKIKSIYFHVAGTDMLGKAVIMGALELYLDFVNMFQFLLSFMGNRE